MNTHKDSNLGGSWDQAPDERRNPQCLGRSQGRHEGGRATMNSFSATVLHEAASSDNFSKEGGCRGAPVSDEAQGNKSVKQILTIID